MNPVLMPLTNRGRRAAIVPLFAMLLGCSFEAPASHRGAPNSGSGGGTSASADGAPNDASAPEAGGRDAANDFGGGRQTGGVPGIFRVWAVHDGEKIERDELSSPFAVANTAWDGKRVKLFAAQNEVVAFQIVVESTAAGIAGLEVSLPKLTLRGGSSEITYESPGQDPSASINRPIQLFVENYMSVEQPSRAHWVFEPDGAAAPDDPTGEKPVQLVPENARAGRGGLPIDVAPRQNQAFWFEIYVGRSLPSGVYEGDIRLSADRGEHVLPVELEVFDFALPDEPSMSAMLYFEPDQVARYHGRALEERYHRFAHRHRVELVHAYSVASATSALGRFRGAAFTSAYGYQGPGAGIGNRIVPASFYGPGDAYDEASSAQQASDAWMSFLGATLPEALTFLYMPDEPGPSEYDRIRTIKSNLLSGTGPGRNLPVFVTASYRAELDGFVDIWCATGDGFNPSRVATERAKGRRYWFYNGRRPETGALIIEAPATDARVSAWAAFKHDVEVYFYWHSVHWRHNGQKVGERDQNVWQNPVTFDNRGQPGKPIADQGFINGDGVLLYPGEDVLHPEEDRGIAGPVASVRLANLRRGLQDHQYLTLARERGLSSEVARALQSVVPDVFVASSRVGFSERGDNYERARRQLAEAIAAAGGGGPSSGL
jgi:hypothetical protein